MAISPGYSQFPRQRVPQISPGINSSNVALKALKEQQDIAEATKKQPVQVVASIAQDVLALKAQQAASKSNQPLPSEPPATASQTPVQ
ncbi:MAG: hypothetical protein V7K76_26025 [Nostoc sp.]|uniref:hypothetical protein n=1 Tax=Nostoc sp. TaxID=1180 RepID=UPI002FF99056